MRWQLPFIGAIVGVAILLRPDFGGGKRYDCTLRGVVRKSEEHIVKIKRGAIIGKNGKTLFDPKVFLAKVGEGKTISKYRKNQTIFSQGQAADAVFYIQK